MHFTHPISLVMLSCVLNGPLVAVDAVTVDASGNMAVVGHVAAPNVLQGSPGVDVTSEISLTATAFGNWHWISGVSGNYSVSLPTAVDNAGKTIGVRVKDSSVANKVYAITAINGQLIDGASFIPMIASTTLVLMSDGGGWTVIGGQYPSICVEATSNAGQSVTANTTDVQYEDEAQDSHGAWSGTVFTAPAPGMYNVAAAMIQANGNANTTRLILWKNDVAYISGGNAADVGSATAAGSWTLRLALGDTLSIRTNNTTTRQVDILRNWLSITRIGR